MRIFKEEQRFTQLWLKLLVGVSMLIPLGIIVGSYVKESESFSVLEFLLIVGIITFTSGLIFLLKLTTRIDDIGIHYKFSPFHWSFKIIKWAEIHKISVRTYDAISEFGGWGLKGGALWNKKKGKAINVRGNIGIQLELKNGNKLLIGTQKQEEAKRIIATYKPKIIADV